MWWSRKKHAAGPNGSTAAQPQHAQQREQEDSAPNNAVDPPGQAAAASVTKEHPPVAYWKLFSCADRLDVVLIVLGVLGALANGAALPIFSLFFGDFVNAFGTYIPPCLLPPGVPLPPGLLPTSGFRHLIQEIALKFVYLAIGAATAGTLQQGCLQLSSTRMSNRLRHRYLAAVLAQDIAFFDTAATTGGLLQGLNEDAAAVQSAVSDKLGLFLQHLSTFTAGYVLAFTKGWDITLVLVGCLPLLAGMGALLARSGAASAAKAQAAYTEAGAVVQQAVSQVRTVAAYGGERRAVQLYDELLDGPQRVGRRLGLVSGAALGGMQFVMFGSYALSLYYGATQVAAGRYTGGGVVSVIIASLIGSFSLGLGGPLLETFSKGCSAGGRVFALLARAPAIDVATPGLEPARVDGAVELKDVHFAYPARPDAPVLRGLSLSVPAGRTVALVGSSGSGKSTVVGLIERYYDPVSGAVLLDGVDVRALNLGWLRSKVGLVSQEPTLFATSIYENVALGRPGATRAEVEAAVAGANAARFVAALPAGLDTQVGERGVQLSGGQKQRIAIARALLKNPAVLLLDEATSALDAESEAVVQAALDALARGRTTIVIAHRLWTVRNADAIAVVREGRIVELGAHDELLRNADGHYAALVRLQLAASEREATVAAELEEQLSSGAPVTRASLDRVRRRSLEIAQRSSSGRTTGSANDPDAVVVSADAAAAEAAGGGAVLSVAAAAAPLNAVIVHAGEGGHSSSGGASARTTTEAHDALPPPAAAAKGKLRWARRKAAVVPAAAAAPPPKVPFTRLAAYNKPEAPWMALGCLSSAVVGGVQPCFAFVLVSMITSFFAATADEVRSSAGFYGLMFLAIAVAVLLASSGQQYSFAVSGHALARRVRVALFAAILRQDVGWFDDDSRASGRLASLLAADAAAVRGAVGDAAGAVVQNLSVVAVGYALAFSFNWRMALVVTAAAPFIAVGGAINMRHIVGAAGANDSLYAKANAAVTEAVGSIRVIQAYNLQSYVAGAYTSVLARVDRQSARDAAVGGAAMGYSMMAMFSTYALITWFGGEEIASCRSTFDAFFKAFLCVMFAALGLSQAQMAFPDLGKAQAAVARVFPILDRKPPIDAADPGGLRPAEVKGAIALEAVAFHYPSRPAAPVLRGLTLAVPAGQTVALVGESGSGKSTIVGLIERFYDPISGTVLLDGVDVKALNLGWLRSKVGLVSQEPLLFTGSVADNIRYGAPDATDAQVAAAAAVANAADFVAALPDGYETKVGERGVQLSGGQKQRIAIARAVVRDPRVLLLDEATSALDAASEAVVQAALERVSRGRTTLVVAHRLSTVRNADAIAVLHLGVVLERGTHAELLAANGAYARLVAAQQAH